ncbi:hypothetical protein [Beijerinckia sp. L45]|nr:hypothetical protein [Beijerinckia sp. L45]
MRTLLAAILVSAFVGNAGAQEVPVGTHEATASHRSAATTVPPEKRL